MYALLSERKAILLAATVLVLLAVVSACHISQLRDSATDDSYITYLYGRNLAEGHGFRFNPTDSNPTEGFSSLLHVLFVSLTHAAGVDPLLSTRILGLVLFLAIPVATSLVLFRPIGAPFGTTLLSMATPLAILTFLPETRIHLASGMDTMLFAVLHAGTFAWAASLCLGQGPWGHGARASGIILLCALTISRPEGPVLAAGYLIAIACASRRPWSLDTEPFRSLGFVAAGFAIGLLVSLAWKFETFGQLLPNAYYVKSHNAIFGSAGMWLPGLADTTTFLLTRYLPLAVAMGMVLLLGKRSLLRPLALLLLPSFTVAALHARTIHEVTRGFRYGYGQLFPLAVGLGVALAVLAQRRPRAFVALAGVAIVGAPLLDLSGTRVLVSSLDRPWLAATRWIGYRPTDSSDAHARLGLDLEQTGLGQRASILVGSAGMIPYYSRFLSIDWVGLNTSALSGREPLSLEEAEAYIESFEPDVVASALPPATRGISDLRQDPAFGSIVVQRLIGPGHSTLLRQWDRSRVEKFLYWQMSYLRDHYVFGTLYPLRRNRAMIAYVRRDSPHADQILAQLRGSERASPLPGIARSYVNDPRRLR